MQSTILWTVADGLIIGDDTGCVSLVEHDYYDKHPEELSDKRGDWQDAGGNWRRREVVDRLYVIDTSMNTVITTRPDGGEEQIEVQPFVLPHDWVVRAGYLSSIHMWCRQGEPVQKVDERAFIEGRV